MLELDPRAWNLYVGTFLLAAACGSTGSERGDETGAIIGCNDLGDCPPAYACVAGQCQYDPCSSDNDCPVYAHCGWSTSCAEPVEPLLSECEGLATLAIPLDLANAEALALQFVDVDADGQDELAIVTSTTIELFDNPEDPPSSSPRGVESATVRDIAAGQFDDAVGEDLTLLFDDGLWRHGNAGGSGFAPAMPVVIDDVAPIGLLAGELEAGPPTELLVWGAAGAIIERPGATPVQLTGAEVSDATALELGSLQPSILLRLDGTELQVFDPSGSPGVAFDVLGGTSSLGSWAGTETAYHLVTAGDASDWRALWAFSVAPLMPVHEWGIPIRPAEIMAGDLDGDGSNDLVFRDHGGKLWVGFDPLGETGWKHCWWQPEFAPAGAYDAIALGDFDGNGDQELAASYRGQVVILDV